MLFDGKKFAEKIENGLDDGGHRLVILVSSDNEAGKIYSKMKKALGERIGVVVEIIEVDVSDLKARVLEYGGKSEVNGLMVQLPFSGIKKEELQEILDLIPQEKDVDGLTTSNLSRIKTGEQIYLPATVRAVGKVMDEAIREVGLDIEKMKVAVVGSKGMVGEPLVHQLKRFGFEVGEFDLGDDLKKLVQYDVIISATGQGELIDELMVKEGVVAIDVSFPKGDFKEEVKKKAAFFTPVPGGVGPVTVVSLFENLVSANA